VLEVTSVKRHFTNDDFVPADLADGMEGLKDDGIPN